MRCAATSSSPRSARPRSRWSGRRRRCARRGSDPRRRGSQKQRSSGESERIGHGADSITARAVRTDRKNEAAIAIGPDAKHWYMLFVEFGTSRQAPDRFLTPAFEIHKERAVTLIGEELWKSLSPDGQAARAAGRVREALAQGPARAGVPVTLGTYLRRLLVRGTRAWPRWRATASYTEVLPQSPTLPAVVFNEVAGMDDYALDGPTGAASRRVQVDAWAKTRAEATALGTAVAAALSGHAGAAAGFEVQGTFLLSERWGFEPATQLYRTGQDYEMWLSRSSGVSHDDGRESRTARTREMQRIPGFQAERDSLPSRRRGTVGDQGGAT